MDEFEKHTIIEGSKEGRHLRNLRLHRGRYLQQESHTGQKVGQIIKYKLSK